MDSATVIAVSAVLATLIGVWISYNHHKLSVTPRLVGKWHTAIEGKGIRIRYDLCNHGIGPAVIKQFQFFLSKEPFNHKEKAETVKELISAALKSQFPHALLEYSFPSVDYIIPAGSAYNILVLYFSDARKEDIKSVLYPIDLRVDYQSIYGVKDHFDSRED